MFHAMEEMEFTAFASAMAVTLGTCPVWVNKQNTEQGYLLT